MGSPVGWGGGGVTADDDRGCYDPVLPHGGPRLTPVLVSMINSMLPFSMLNLSKSMLTFFDITYLYQIVVSQLVFFH